MTGVGFRCGARARAWSGPGRGAAGSRGRRACPRPARFPRLPASAASAGLAPPARACSAARARSGVGPHVRQGDAAVDGGHADDGPVIGPADEFLVAPGRAGPARHADGRDQLARVQAGLEEPGEKVVGRYVPGAALAQQVDRATQRDQRHRQVGRGIRVRQRAADRAAVPDLRIADLRSGMGEQRCVGPDQVGGGQRRRAAWPRRSPARSPSARIPVSSVSRPMSMSTDGRGQAQLHHRQQRVAARQQLRVLAEAGQQVEGVRRPNRRPRSRTAPGSLARPAASAPAGPAVARPRPAALGHGRRGGQHRADDVVVAGAAAEVALQALPDLGLGRVRVLREQADRPPSPCPGVQNPHCRPCSWRNAACTGCSSPSVARPSAVVTCCPLACTVSTVHDFTDCAVQQHRAGAARGGVAADVGGPQAAHLAQVVHQQQPRLDVVGPRLRR